MNSTGCISLAGSLVKTRGTPGFFGQLVKQPFLQLNREYHDPCEPRHLSWQWRVKDSPDVQRCSKLCLKKKACPKKRFFPRFKKSFIYNDIFACDPPKEKKQTWGEYLSFLLPDDITTKPQMATCRKMLEHRRRKCMDVDNYTKCVQGQCWPLPTEWYGQGVLHISELALTRPPYKPVETVKPCPPPSSMITKCVTKKLPVCPSDDLFCLEDTSRKMPYSQFKGADTDGGPPSITLRCPIKYVPEMMPDKHQDKHYKLSCKTYGDFKSVECPPQMFNRYMDVDFSSKNLLPIPTTMPGYTPQREVKKGVCGRQTLLRPPSARNFSTGQAFMMKEYPEFIKLINTNHLQPGRSPICFDKLVERAGMNVELLNKPHLERPYEFTHRSRGFTEKELEKHELEAQISEESPAEKLKRIESKKSKLQMLIEKQNKESGKKLEGAEKVKSTSILGDHPMSTFGPRLVDLEEVPYQRSKFHTSANSQARKGNDRNTGGQEDKICSGCPGIRGAEEGKQKQKSKCSISRGGVRGRCRVNRPLRPEDRLNPLSVKCKGVQDSPCMRARESRMEVVKSFQVRSAGYPCFPPSRHDSKRSLNEMKIRENRIYGEKMAAGATINEGQIETSVPFRSPLTVVLGRSPMSINEVRGKIMVENEDDLRAITVGPTDVMKIFSDRYEALVERKHRFTPFKDNNMSLWGKEHEGLERQLANIDKKYKFHSKSSPDLNADRFFEKIQELPEALRQAQEDPVIVHTINTRPKKEEMDGEMGEYIRSRRYRKETTDEFREAHNKRVSDMEANRKRVGDFNEYNNRSSLASTFPKTQPRTDSRFKQEQEEKQGSNFFGRAHREKDEDGFHKRAKPNRNQIDQAIIDWRLQTAVDSRIASESVPSIREPNTEVGRKKKWQKEEDRESRWSSGVKKSGVTKVRNTTDINVADTKSAKITLRRLLQETALSRAKDANPSGEEAIERPASRRRKIRKKCSELLASRTDNSEHGDNKMTSKIPHVRLVPKMSMTSIQSNASIDQNRAHQKEWSPVRPTVKKRSLRVIGGEVTSVANDSSKSGELLGRKTSEYKPEMYGKGISEQRRKKQLGDEILSFESVLKMKGENQKNSEGSSTINHATERARRRLGPRRLRRKRPLGDEVLSFESVMKMKSENLKNSMVTPNSKECNAELGKKGRTVDQNKNQDNRMSEDGDQREEIGESVDSGTVKNSGTVIAKESQRSNSDKKAEGKTLLKEQRNENCRAEDNAVVRTGRQNKAQVQVVTQTEKVVPNDEQPETPSKEASNSEQLSKENAENSRAENTLKEKKTKEDKDISLPPPKSSSDYSEIWKHV